ncbi:hypothetical protein NUG23_15365 [Streptomyces sp. PAL114]|nr:MULTISPECIES: hypothetical protein [unclassified Streptomyces]MDU0301752.1 hypothetical protein [Streptomyces sp. PAL114]
MRRQGPPARDPGAPRPTPRQCLRTPAAGTDPRSPHRPGPTMLPSRPGRGIAHTIPEKTDQRRHRLRRGWHGGRPPGFDRETYRRRNLIERCFNRLKGFRGIATSYEKTATSYEAAVTLASFLLWARSL